MSTQVPVEAAAAPSGPGPGLTQTQVEQARRDDPSAGRRKAGGRTYGQIARTNIFSFYNNILFVIGGGLLALGRINDAVVSVGLGLINAVIGAVQEMRAKRQLDQLSLLHRSLARVVRDGTEHEVGPEDLVRGDLLRLAAGEQLVVDGPLEGPGRLEIDESLLTGESDVVVKTTGDRLLSGSFVVSGDGYQRAEAVGADSHAQSVTAAAQQWSMTKTPLQRQIDLVVRAVILTVLLMSLAILGQASMEGLPLVRLVQISAVLSGLVPYGLFFLIAVAYAVGAATIARRGALVQRVNAVESLSNVDVVCTDKTGTLTTGRLQLHTVHPLTEALEADQLSTLLGTMAHSAGSANLTTAALRDALPARQVPLRAEVPFAAVRRWSAVALAGDDPVVLVLGAVSALTPAVTLADSTLAGAVDSYAAQGLRVLMLARAIDPAAALVDPAGDPQLPPVTPLALVALRDELRPRVRETIADLQGAGVELKVISGDDPQTVAALAAQLGLTDERPVAGVDLAAMTADEFDEAVRERSVFGRVAPEQKEQIVDSLINAGHYVAMIGDGVNDIRSLKRAQVGVAMESGSSVARDVADLVLLGDSFAALPVARLEGQRIIGGLAIALKLFLSRVAISIVCIIGIGILGLGFPYEPAQVALTLFTVGLPTMIMTLWARPQRPDPHLIKDLVGFVLPVAVVTGVFAVALYAAFATLLTRALVDGMLPEGAVVRFETYLGMTRTDISFNDSVSVAVAQTGLSMFTAVAAFLLIVFLEPPFAFFTGWSPVRADKRPALLAAALLVIFVVILLIPQTADYFELVQPGGFVGPLVAGTTVVWFFAMRATWRLDLMQRALGLAVSPRDQSEHERPA